MKAMLSNRMGTTLRAALLATLALGTAGAHGGPAEQAPPQPARDVDLSRFLGRWYVIARMPARGEHHALAAYFEYRQRADGGIDDLYSIREQSFDRPPQTVERVARADPAEPARWEVREGWLSSSDRLLLYVSPDYRYALAGDPDRTRAWMLAREPEIAEWSYAGLLARLAMQGYDVSLCRRVPQRPEQVGRWGFD